MHLKSIRSAATHYRNLRSAQERHPSLSSSLFFRAKAIVCNSTNFIYPDLCNYAYGADSYLQLYLLQLHTCFKNAVVLSEADLFNSMFHSIFMLFRWLPFCISRAGALATAGVRHIHKPWIYLVITAGLLILFLNLFIWNMNNNLMPSGGEEGLP